MLTNQVMVEKFEPLQFTGPQLAFMVSVEEGPPYEEWIGISKFNREKNSIVKPIYKYDLTVILTKLDVLSARCSIDQVFPQNQP